MDEYCEEKIGTKRKLFQPSDISIRIKDEFEHIGWKKSYYCGCPKTSRAISKDASPGPPIHQVDIEQDPTNLTELQKNRVAVEVQLMNYDSAKFDVFIKHVGFYKGNTIDVAVEILPTSKMQYKMLNCSLSFEKVLNRLTRQGRCAPTVPLVLLGVEP